MRRGLLPVSAKGGFDRVDKLLARHGFVEWLTAEESDGLWDELRLQGTTHDDHLGGGIEPQRRSGDIESIDLGHEQVRQHEVPWPEVEHREAIASRTSDRDVVSRTLQEATYGSPHFMMIIDEEYSPPEHNLVYHNLGVMGSPLGLKESTNCGAFDESQLCEKTRPRP